MKEAPADNIFGKILRRELPSWEIHSDELSYAFLDIFPQSEGHTLVIPRSYSENILECSTEELAACMATVRRLMPAVRRAMGAGGITVLTNTGIEAGQSVPYLHFHIIPRHGSDKVSLYTPGAMLQEEDARRIQQAIRAELH
ncbi:HIT domain-containing protein [bacterium]|nr:HIT domain-containing protein [bacterium]